MHISITGKKGSTGVAVCEQIKLVDPSSRNCMSVDRIENAAIMNISDAIQGVFEYD